MILKFLKEFKRTSRVYYYFLLFFKRVYTLNVTFNFQTLLFDTFLKLYLR